MPTGIKNQWACDSSYHIYVYFLSARLDLLCCLLHNHNKSQVHHLCLWKTATALVPVQQKCTHLPVCACKRAWRTCLLVGFRLCIWICIYVLHICTRCVFCVYVGVMHMVLVCTVSCTGKYLFRYVTCPPCFNKGLTKTNGIPSRGNSGWKLRNIICEDACMSRCIRIFELRRYLGRLTEIIFVYV